MANLKTRLLAVWVAAVRVSSARLRCWSAMCCCATATSRCQYASPASTTATTRPAARLPVRMLRRRLAARRLSATKAWVSSVGSGAPCGRDAIHRSASSSTGERSNSPLADRSPPSAVPLRHTRCAAGSSRCRSSAPRQAYRHSPQSAPDHRRK